MAVEIISWSISRKVWGRAGIKLATHGSAVRHVPAVRHVSNCTSGPGLYNYLSDPVTGFAQALEVLKYTGLS